MRVRTMAIEGAKREEGDRFDPGLHERVISSCGVALAEKIDPASALGGEILESVLPARSTGDRVALRQRLETFTDARVERYWVLLGILNGRPPHPSMVPQYQWLIDALRARES